MIQTLTAEQAYVAEHAEKLGIYAELKKHDRATSTCEEKAELLGEEWDASRVIKALYFSNGESLIGVVTPQDGRRVDLKKLVRSAQDRPGPLYGMSGRAVKRYSLRDHFPTGMEAGTCSPFLLESSIGEEITAIIVCDRPELTDILTDISVGGVGKESHRISMHIPYDGIHRILAEKFGDRVYKV